MDRSYQTQIIVAHIKYYQFYKFLIVTSPSGDIMMISESFGGHTTDSEIVTKSGVIKYFKEGNRSLADKGFPQIIQVFKDKGIFVTMPPKKVGDKQFTTEENELSYDIAMLRVDVERCIRTMKVFDVSI